MVAKKPYRSSSWAGRKSRNQLRTSAVADAGHAVGPQMTLRTGCSRNVNEVTTPKLPPPPRSAQNRSGCSDSDAVTTRPSASTTSASIRLSIVRPCLRDR